MSSEKVLEGLKLLNMKYAHDLEDEHLDEEVRSRRAHHEWMVRQASEYYESELFPFRGVQIVREVGRRLGSSDGNYPLRIRGRKSV